MITIEELQTLYTNGNYQECLNELDLFLLVNQQNIEAALLEAKCKFQIAYQNNSSGGNALDQFIEAYKNFQYVIQLNQNHEEAMLFLAYIDIFFIQDHLTESIGYCSRLASSSEENNQMNAIAYRYQAYCLMDDFDEALADLETLMELNNYRYKDNLVALDRERSVYCLQKAAIYLEHKDDVTRALKVYDEGLEYLQANADVFYKVANLAFDNHQYELGGRAAVKAIYGTYEDSMDLASVLYDRINEFIAQGIENKFMVYYQFITSRVLDIDLVEILSLAKHYIKIYPEWAIPYHYAGAVLHDAKSYQEAYPYLKKTVEIGGGRIAGTRRYIETAYRITGELPVIENWPNDQPLEYYAAGVTFQEETESSIGNAANATDLIRIRAHFYEIAYESYYNYFYNNTGNSENNDPHTFAMCCNNYGIALRELKEYEKAVEVHKIGYTLSPFWEQLDNLGNALMFLERYDEAIEVFSTAVTYDSNYLGFTEYINLKAGLLDATFKSGKKEEAKILLLNIEEEYERFIEEEKANLSEEDLFILSERYIVVQNVRCDLLMEGSPEDAIKAWQGQLEKNPDDNSNWFMLMQNYYQIKEYKQCIACADNYELVKKEAIKPESSLKMHYMRGTSYLKLEHFQEAKENLKISLQILMTSIGTEMESDLAKVNLYLAECSIAMRQWEECMTFAWDAIDCYNRNGWYWDEDRIQATLHYADACQAIGEKKAALGTVDSILEMVPGNEEALKRKKEWASGGLFSFLKKR